MALVRTDYGLIYNTDGSLCATLLPEGGVAVEEGTTNRVPSNRLKFEGWVAFSGAQVTLTQNVEFPEIGRNDATRIRTTGGTDYLKYFINIGMSIADQAYTGSVYIKNIGSKPVRFGILLGSPITVNPGEWTRAIVSGIGNGTTNFQLRFETLNVDDDLDFIAWGPQAEDKPFATSSVEGTRPPGALDIPTNLSLLQSGTIAFTVWTPKKMTDHDTYQNGALMNICQGDVRQLDLWMHGTGIEFCVNDERKKIISYEPNTKYKIIVTWEDGGNPKFYVDGALQYAGTEQFTDAGNGILQLGRFRGSYVNTVNFKNLLLRPYAVSSETIATWHSLDAPFFDPNDRIDAGARPIYAPGVVIDQTGAWGIANGVKQAGFGTDWKWVAGGGAIIADAQGLRSNNGFFSIGTNGQAYFGGTLKAAIVDTPQIVGGAISQKIVNNYYTNTFFEISGYYSVHRDHLNIPYLSVNFTLDYASQVLINVSMATYSVVSPQDLQAAYGIYIWVDGSLVPHATRGIQPPEATSTYFVSFQIPVNISTALSLGAGSHSIQVTAMALSSAKSSNTRLGIASREINVLIFKR